jgi:hypothetical protein
MVKDWGSLYDRIVRARPTARDSEWDDEACRRDRMQVDTTTDLLEHDTYKPLTWSPNRL